MADELLQDNLYWSLLQTAFRAKHSLMHLAEKYDLALMQMYTLCSMATGQPLPMSSISSLLLCDASNVTGIVDRLFSRKLIAREESSHDRRVKMVTLTKQGEQLRRRILADLQTYEPEAFQSLDAHQKQALQKLTSMVLTEPSAKT